MLDDPVVASLATFELVWGGIEVAEKVVDDEDTVVRRVESNAIEVIDLGVVVGVGDVAPGVAVPPSRVAKLCS